MIASDIGKICFEMCSNDHIQLNEVAIEFARDHFVLNLPTD